MLTPRGTRTCQGASKCQYCPYITTIVPNTTTRLGVNVTGKVTPPATLCQKKDNPADFEVVPFCPICPTLSHLSHFVPGVGQVGTA